MTLARSYESWAISGDQPFGFSLPRLSLVVLLPFPKKRGQQPFKFEQCVQNLLFYYIWIKPGIRTLSLSSTYTLLVIPPHVLLTPGQ